MAATTFPYLTTLVLVPAMGAGIVALIPRKAVAAWFHEAIGVAVTVLTLVGVLVTSTLAAFAFAFKEFKGREPSFLGFKTR